MKLLIFIIFIISVLNLNCAQAVERPRCITTNNIYVNSGHTKPDDGKVDWWFLNQLINQDAIYTDSSLKETILEVKEYNTRKNKESPLYNTYIQSYDPSKYHSITYNEQIDTTQKKFSKRISDLLDNKKKPNAGSAHSKGYFIWNSKGGIHVIHSFPNSPTVDTTRFVPPKGDQKFSQHAMCIELSVSELEIIPKYLIYGNADLQTINNQRLKCWKGKVNECLVSLSLVENTVKVKNKDTGVDEDKTVNAIAGWDFTGEFDATLKTELDGITDFEAMETFFKKTILKTLELENDIGLWKQIAYKIAGSKITSTTEKPLTNVHYFKVMEKGSIGKYFIQTSNGYLRANYQSKTNDKLDQMKYEIIWKYIKKHYTQAKNWISHTMTWDRRNDDSLFKTDDDNNIHLVYKFQSETKQVANNRETLKEISTTEDHSKLLYGSNDDNSFTVFCVGDLNWQGVQILRGGGAFCRTDLGYLVDYYTRKISWFRSYDTKRIPNTNAILNSLFTKRSTYDLMWIKNGLKDKYQLDNYLIEFTPSSYPKASFFLGEDFNSMLKLKVSKPANYQQTTPVTVNTESFSLNVYPSIPDKVFICPMNFPPKCDLESLIKVEVLTDVTLPITYTIPDLSGRSFTTKDDGFAVKIDVDQPNPLVWKPSRELTDYAYCVTIASKYVEKESARLQTDIEPISLIREINKDNFKNSFSFPLSNSMIPIDQICNANVGTGTSILFNEECLDLLFICLYHDDTTLDLSSKSKDDVISTVDSEIQNSGIPLLSIKTCLVQDLSNNDGDQNGEADDDEIEQIAKRLRTLG